MHHRRIISAIVAVLCFSTVALSCLAAETRNQTALSYVELGNKLSRQGDFDKAIAAYNVALQFAPDSVLAFFHRALAYESAGNVADALADYSKAVQLSPDLTTGWYNRGNLRLQQGDFAGAL